MINNRGNLGAVLKDVTSEEALKGYAVGAVTAGLTAGVFDKWTSTETGANTAGAATGNSGVLANSGAVASAGGLSSWSGIGQFAANQALQNGTSTLLNKALGQGGSLGDALQTTLANTFAAAGFNFVGDISMPDQMALKDGSLAKIGLHAVMGGLAAEAAGGDFKTGALAAGINEALVSSLAKQYESMDPDKKKGLLVMNSQLIGVLAAAAQGGDEKDLQTGAWVAGSATQHNFLNHAENQERWEAKKKCDGGNEAACGRVAEMDRLDRDRDLALASACGSGGSTSLCSTLRAEAWEAAKSLKRASWSSEAQQQYQEAMQNPELYAYTIEAELKSNFAVNKPIDEAQVRRLAAGLADIGTDFVPVYGDAKAFAEAEDGFDYLIATVSIIPAAGDAAGKVLKRAKDLYRQGEVEAAADLVEAVTRSTPGAKEPTRFIDGVKVVDQKTGQVLQGTVDLGPTLDRIKSGGSFPHRNDGSIFQNRAGDLPPKPAGYYTEYVHPTPGVSGPGPQRIVVGKGGEMYYTVDHYKTFIPINK